MPTVAGIRQSLSTAFSKGSSKLSKACHGTPKFEPKFTAKEGFKADMKTGEVFKPTECDYKVTKTNTGYKKEYTVGDKKGQTREYKLDGDAKSWTKTKIKVSTEAPKFTGEKDFETTLKKDGIVKLKDKNGNSYEVKKSKTNEYTQTYTEGPQKGQTCEYKLGKDGKTWTETTTSAPEASYMDSAKNWVSNHKLATAGITGGLGIVGYSMMSNDDESVQAQEAQVGSAQMQQETGQTTAQQNSIFPEKAGTVYLQAPPPIY